MPRRAILALWLLVLSLAWGGAATSAQPAGAPATVGDFPGSEVFRPATEARGAIVVLHGSEGGRAPYAPALARRLAQEGLVAAAFCWFGCEGLPEAVHRVALERTLAFLAWFREGPAGGMPVVLHGASRGAEHALLLASLVQETAIVAGVSAHAGTDTVVAAFDPRTGGPVVSGGQFDAAWTWQGKALFGERRMPFGSGPRIAIERYPGPVLLSHGADDPMWPAARSRRLLKARGELPTEAHFWPGEGHVLASPHHVEAYVQALVAFVARVREG